MDAEQQRKLTEREEYIAPNPSTLSDPQLNELRQQAQTAHVQRRQNLGSEMKFQYQNSISSKIQERNSLKAREADEAARRGEAIRAQEQYERAAKAA